MSEREMFEAALELPLADRESFLDSACGNDTTLRQRLKGLLTKHDKAGDFLEDPVVSAPARDPEADAVGHVLAGRYRLLEQIGEGGMGTVWLAQQTEPVQRTVAVKLLKCGIGSKAVLARFQAERQALALMDHPNIARVLDAGTSSDGRPFFVMELVQGVPITKYCDAHQLTLRQRLELFVPVCQAIQHAHHKAIIHRDLKPSNVLVARYDDRPVAKVIDFGVAKAAGQHLTEQTLNTGLGALIGTVEYMSPEQASFNPWDIDTRSDIYSLGVLLYELLTGAPPFTRKHLEKAGLLEMLRVIREEEPAKPSVKVAAGAELPALAAQRGTEPKRLAALMRGELDWIVMKALEKDRRRRYETANAFALDVQRHLADEPVQACPASAWHRLRKFASRNKRALASAALVAVMLVAVVGVVAGNMGWVARDRAARLAEFEREVNAMLAQATLLRDQGKWPEARTAAQNVKPLAEQTGTAEQQARVRRFLADLDMAARLDEISLWLIRGTYDANSTVEARVAYAAAFQEYGIDIGALEPATAAERIRDSAISENLLAALDDWAWNHDYAVVGVRASQAARDLLITVEGAQKPAPVVDVVPCECVRTVANLADRDEWRRRIRPLPRTVFDQRGQQELDALTRKANGADLPPATALLLARAFCKAWADDKAVGILYAAQQRHPGDLRLNYELAWHSSRGKSGPPQLDKAAGFLRSALVMRPQSPALHFGLGQCLLQTGELDQAIAAFRKVTAVEPNHGTAYFGLALALAGKRAANDAVAALTRAMELKRDSHILHRERGRMYAELGRWDLAAADYDRAAKLHWPDQERWCEHAGVLLLAGKDQAYRELSVRVAQSGAQGNLVTLFSSNNKNARFRYLAARTAVLGAGADAALVVKLAQQAVAAKPKNPEYLHALGMAHVRARDFDRAIQRLHESAEIDPAWPGNVVNWLGLAIAHHHAGDADKAKHWLGKAEKWIETAAAASTDPSLASIPGLSLNDWLTCRILSREAGALVKAESGRRNPEFGVKRESQAIRPPPSDFRIPPSAFRP